MSGTVFFEFGPAAPYPAVGQKLRIGDQVGEVVASTFERHGVTYFVYEAAVVKTGAKLPPPTG